MRDQMEKRPYTAPKVVRVKLTHEQAVLSACTVTATTMSNRLDVKCKVGVNCRRGTSTPKDSENVS